MVTLQDLEDRISKLEAEYRPYVLAIAQANKLTELGEEFIVTYRLKYEELNFIKVMHSCLKELGPNWTFDFLPDTTHFKPYKTTGEDYPRPFPYGRIWDIKMESIEVGLYPVGQKDFPYEFYFKTFSVCLRKKESEEDPTCFRLCVNETYGQTVKRALQSVGYCTEGEENGRT